MIDNLQVLDNWCRKDDGKALDIPSPAISGWKTR